MLSEPTINKEQEEERIYLHAIGENQSLDLIRIAGEVNGVPVIALVDSGSTHSFVDPKIVKQAGYDSTPTKPMEITVANGAKMYCEHKCDGMLWVMQGKEFQFDMKVLEVGSYEGEIGFCCYKKEGPILFGISAPSITLGRQESSLKGRAAGSDKEVTQRINMHFVFG
jgi:hypothetical protein